MKANNQEIQLNQSCTIKEFLESNHYNPQLVAIELNGAIVPKKDFETQLLCDADTIEIVSFVGGG